MWEAVNRSRPSSFRRKPNAPDGFDDVLEGACDSEEGSFDGESESPAVPFEFKRCCSA